MTSYRYPNEQLLLFGTICVLLTAGFLAAGATLCLLPLLIAVIAVFSYQVNRNHHQQLIQKGMRVTRQNAPGVAALAEDCLKKLKPGPVELFVVPSRELNAYTFGLENPRVVVLFGSLFKYMDADEIRFILGHELGHVALGHTWLNTLLGGMAGVPLSLGAAVVLVLAFRWWNRACEFSADRAGLLACGNVDKAVSALVKLVNKEADTPEEQEVMFDLIDRQDDSVVNVLTETLATHPMIIRRIEQLRAYAASAEYRRLQAEINRA